MSRDLVLFDLDGTLVDSVYQHVLAWKEALDAEGVNLSVWRIHRKIGMSGGLVVSLARAVPERIRAAALEVLVSATPILLTGVSVAIAFRAGFWNIGRERAASHITIDGFRSASESSPFGADLSRRSSRCGRR